MGHEKIWILFAAALLFSVPFFMKGESFSGKEQSSSGEACRIVVNVEGSEIPLEQYVIGVVSAEMPAVYELEALKAQAPCCTDVCTVPAAGSSTNGISRCKCERNCTALL